MFLLQECSVLHTAWSKEKRVPLSVHKAAVLEEHIQLLCALQQHDLRLDTSKKSVIVPAKKRQPVREVLTAIKSIFRTFLLQDNHVLIAKMLHDILVEALGSDGADMRRDDLRRFRVKNTETYLYRVSLCFFDSSSCVIRIIS